MQRIKFSTPHSVLKDRDGSRQNTYTFRDEALVYSQNNRFDKRRGHYISGGPFHVYKTWDSISEIVKGRDRGALMTSAAPWEMYLGPGRMSPYTSFASESATKLKADSEIANAFSYGATGWKRARPGNPTAGLSNFMLELRSLPTLPLRLFNRLRSFRALGSEYLNVVFGWLPFVKDVQDMYETYRKIDRQLAWIVRNNGKGVHRRRMIKDEKNTTSVVTNSTNSFAGWLGVMPPLPFSGHMGTQTTTSRMVSEKVWFVGKFRYYIPDIGSSQWTKRATRALYGANITPEVLWNALPWSWLIDWFGNIGDVMSNMSSNAVENLTADYAFVMRETQDIETITSTTSWRTMGPDRNYDIKGGTATASRVNLGIVTKSRSRGSPFGFGAHFDSLSNYQLGIAAALGISRWA